MSVLLEAINLSVGYGQVEALNAPALRIEEGQIVAVTGPNGAGKTTMLGVLAGLLPYKGNVTYRNNSIDDSNIERRVEMGISLVPEKRELFSSMTVLDTLVLGSFATRSPGGPRLDRVFSIFPRLAERREQLAGTLSGGESQMLALGWALMAEPKLLLLDEPSLGLSPRIVQEIFRVIGDLRRNGALILLVEQNARAALKVADYGYVLETGTVTLQGAASEPEQPTDRRDLFEQAKIEQFRVYLSSPSGPWSIYFHIRSDLKRIVCPTSRMTDLGW